MLFRCMIDLLSYTAMDLHAAFQKKTTSINGWLGFLRKTLTELFRTHTVTTCPASKPPGHQHWVGTSLGRIPRRRPRASYRIKTVGSGVSVVVLGVLRFGHGFIVSQSYPELDACTQQGTTRSCTRNTTGSPVHTSPLSSASSRTPFITRIISLTSPAPGAGRSGRTSGSPPRAASATSASTSPN